MKKYGIWFLTALLMTGIALSGQKKPEPVRLPLEPDQYMWQFGMIPRDGWVSHHYALTNTHEDTVTITEIVNDCDCTHIPKMPVSIAPGDTYLLKVLFDSKTYVGETNRDIHLITDYQPNPEMTIYFTSLTSRLPNTISIDPRSTAFITGKDSQLFTINNLTDEKARFTVYLDNDSILAVSETEFTINGNQSREIKVSPRWDRIPTGAYRSCLVIEVSRKEAFRVSVPIKVNKF
jgi:hypothetical protein